MYFFFLIESLCPLSDVPHSRIGPRNPRLCLKVLKYASLRHSLFSTDVSFSRGIQFWPSVKPSKLCCTRKIIFDSTWR